MKRAIVLVFIFLLMVFLLPSNVLADCFSQLDPDFSLCKNSTSSLKCGKASVTGLEFCCDAGSTCPKDTPGGLTSECKKGNDVCVLGDALCDSVKFYCDFTSHIVKLRPPEGVPLPTFQPGANEPIPGEVICINSKSINTAIGCIPFGDANELIGFILKWALGIAGGIAFLLILLAGFQIMTSRGDPNRLKAGQELLTSAIAGLVLLIFSIFILRVIGVDILKIPGFGTK